MDKQEFAQKPKEGGIWDVAIIGSGPAGLTAAIYTTRGALSTIVFAGGNWGGQLMLTTDVDNFPGFPEGVLGPDLMNKMRSQAERFGAEVLDKDVESINRVQNGNFEIVVGNEKYVAKSVIAAVGAQTKWLGVPGEDKLRGRGISSCAPCDAPFYKDKKVAVIGGGDSAMEEALVLTKYASEVILVHRRNEFKASKAMQKRVFDNKKINVVWDSKVEDFLGEQSLSGIKIKNLKTNEVKEVELSGVFVAIGHKPSTGIFKDVIDLDEKGYIKRVPNEKFQMSTSVEGIFTAGDVHDIHYKQAITAAGFGCQAAMEVIKYLEGE